jgi:hypothetical protein
MNLPIQAAPIDRTNRAINAHVASPRGVTPAVFDPRAIICTACDFLPGPAGLICKLFCGLTSH